MKEIPPPQFSNRLKKHLSLQKCVSSFSFYFFSPITLKYNSRNVLKMLRLMKLELFRAKQCFL
jgi:hypothetical protein